jgi:hypothetical protein
MVRRIDALFEIERSINGKSADERLAVRQRLSAPLVADLEAWMREQRAKLSRSNDIAKSMDYMLKRWTSFTLFLKDGRVCLSNNAAERALRGIAMIESFCTPPQVSGNIGICVSESTRHGRPFRLSAAATFSDCRSAARI